MDKDNMAVRELPGEGPTSQELIRQFYVSGLSGEFMTFDPGTREGAELLVKCTLGQPKELASLANTPIEVSHFYVTDAASADDDGEETAWKRTVLVTPSGETYSCGSQGVLKSLYVIMLARRSVPWIPPVKFIVRLAKTSKKHNWMFLEPDMESVFGHASKTRK
jgi:hypothetical protein